MKQLLFILAFMVPLLGAGPAAAERLPAWYPVELSDPLNRVYHSGTIDEVDFASGKIIINDRIYRFDEDSTVMSRSSRDDSQGRLRQGVKVGFRLNAPAPQGNHIQAFWLLPSQFEPAAPVE